MKKTLLLALALVLFSLSAIAADCDPVAVNKSISDKAVKAQANPEKLAKIAEPMAALSAEIQALAQKGDQAALCAKLVEFDKLLDSAL